MRAAKSGLERAGTWLPVGICGGAFLLRLIGLNSRPVWYDEAFAILFAGKGLNAMLAGTLTPVQGAAADVHPLAYYAILNGWMTLAGQSPLAARLLSAFAGVLAAVIAYQIGRRLLGRRPATAGLAISAVLPFQVDYSQEARMYAGLALFCVLTIWFFVRATTASGSRLPDQPDSKDRSHLPDWIGLALSAAAAMYMQNLAAVFLLAFGLSTLLRPRVFAKVAAAGAAAFGLWLPWFLNLPGQLAKLQQAYWVTTPDGVTLLQTVLVYHAGEEMLEARMMLPLALFASLALPILLIWQVFKTRREIETRRAAWLLALAFGTPIGLFLVSLYQPVYIQRALLPAGLIYAPVLGWLVWPRARLSPTTMPAAVRGLLAAVLGAVAAFGLAAHYGFAQFPRPDFPEAVAFLRDNVKPDDRIVHSNKLSFFPMYYYDRGLPQAFVADPAGSGSDTLALPTQLALGLFASPDVRSATKNAPRVWFIIFDRAIQEYAPAQHPHLTWLAQNYVQSRLVRFDDLAIYEFVAPPP